ncbi:hypothetical protein XA68_11285 [Ophiocordyceps unilateralis]|uniref:Laccase n=1 Tax=Ophiocordyceps unilateralis TaxID=268505 RepID=A0A2A9PH59_OPHUN|nr:hypothetical protein XA68_11285 [Ophiocordyceps unilateralis]
MVLAANSLQPRAVIVENRLPQQRTNGRSLLGTLLAPVLPFFLSSNPLPNGFPWSTLNLNTNYYRDHPRTGVIRSYDFTVSRNFIAPDGYQQETLLVNGAFPGPRIEANWGDTIQVTVRNNITGPEEGVALHWHGFLQHGKPWEDGVPAVTQCPIAPGKSFTYQFEAELYGSTWYHSHYSSQYAAGLVGPITIYGPRQRSYDVDLGPVMLSDWYHKKYYDLVKQSMTPNSPPIGSDNILINGKGNFDCTKRAAGDTTPCVSDAGISKFKFQRGKTHRLRLINAGAEALMRFSIDGHKMTVIANDFVPVEPYDTEVVTLGIGQRTDVLVKADGKLDAYWMRANVSVPCSLAAITQGLAAVYYDQTNDTKTPQSVAWDRPDPGTCANDDLNKTRPYMKLRLPQPDRTYNFDVSVFRNDSGVTLWKLGNTTYRGNYNSPTLLLSALGNFTFQEEWNVQNTQDARSVRVIVRNRSPVAHPMHLHGFNMYILHEGEGDWDGSIIHPENPQRRDVMMLRKNGHLVMQFDASENPGVWPFHCHIAWHSGAGFLTQFTTGATALKKLRPPNVVAETCRQWATWTHTNIPDQIDSGL